MRRLLPPVVTSAILVVLLLTNGIGSTALAQTAFYDVPTTAWYAGYVQQAVSLGVVSGYKDVYGNLTGRFGPENNVTIGEALKISLESAGYDANLGQGYGHWAAKYLSIALGEHFAITQNRAVILDMPANRAEVASMIRDAFRVPVTTQAAPYTDVTTTTSYSADISALTAAGIVSGDTTTQGTMTGKFRPLDSINRAETVKIAVEARSRYGTPGNRSSSSSSRSSSSVSSSSSLGACSYYDCGYAPGMPNWYCPDGSIGGLSCERIPDGRCAWIIRQCGMSSSNSSRSSSSSSSSSSSVASVTYNVIYTNTGFQPSYLTIHVGDKVAFKNQSGLGMWVASNPHPTHNDYPGFDANGTTGSGGTFTFTFGKNGVYGYHNHLKSQHQAVLSIEQR